MQLQIATEVRSRRLESASSSEEGRVSLNSLTRPRLSLGSVTYTFTDWESLRPDLLSCLPWTPASKHALRMANALKFGLSKPCSLLFRLLSARPLSGRTGTAIDGRVIKFHGFSVPPSALRRSKVSHRLRLSTRALSRTFRSLLACFISLLLLITVIPSLERFPSSRDEYHSRGATFGFDESSWPRYRDAGQHCESDLLPPTFDSSNAGSLFRVISQLQRHGARTQLPV